MPKEIYPPKLKAGDTIAVIAPSDTLDKNDQEKIDRSIGVLKDFGLTVQFADGVFRPGNTPLRVATSQQRLNDLHQAFENPDIKGIIIAAGGENANQIIQEVDYKLIKNNPKIICGYSDNTVLLNAITNQTGLATYYGPNFGGFGSKKGGTYTREYIEKCLMSDQIFKVHPSKTWYDKDYTQPGKPLSKKHRNTGWWPLSNGTGQGLLVGGEATTMTLLGGLPYAPKLKNKILMLEMYKGSLADFDRYLEWLLMQKGGDKLEGLIIGRFQQSAGVRKEDLRLLLAEKHRLNGVPIIANVDFGHTSPKLTLPIGGMMTMNVWGNKSSITIGEH